MIELEQIADWRKSSRSAQGGDECVEIAGLAGTVAVRDSKNPKGPVLAFDVASFRRFVEAARAGDHDL
ncbi:DUF397 domain-containing protein [Actinomadura sp. HBU206391]|uniref:DUF397 domain-containing protein n=1 Tax=Actinomadura sp. HBU206391 TaxID=2731692 RepID=UPI00164FECDF|nr:DUF397 domain-containing protein [Actinomadura sp. HBU206391]MBC6459028.1 DUF397 domain-containing protein [Actinomadura sp. HBU206391]